MKANNLLAPGVITGPYRKRRVLTPERVDSIGRAVLVMACLAALAATLGFTAGYLNVAGLLR